MCMCVPAVGESGLGVSGSWVVSVDAFLLGSCEKTFQQLLERIHTCQFERFWLESTSTNHARALQNSPPVTQWCLVWPPACGGADTLGTSPCSARLPCEGAASAPPPLSEARPPPLTPPRCWGSPPHQSRRPGAEGHCRGLFRKNKF